MPFQCEFILSIGYTAISHLFKRFTDSGQPFFRYLYKFGISAKGADGVERDGQSANRIHERHRHASTAKKAPSAIPQNAWTADGNAAVVAVKR